MTKTTDKPGWPSEDHPGIAIVAPTGLGTFGIWWTSFPAMERRGGYSGPYKTAEEAGAGAQEWADFWKVPVSIEHRDARPS